MKSLLFFAVLLCPVLSYYDIEFENIKQDFGQELIDCSKLKIARIKGTKLRGLFGPVNFIGSIGDNYKIGGNMYKKQGGEYRLQPFKLPGRGVCEAYNSDPYFMPEIAKASNFTVPMPCPVENITYVFNGYKASMPPVLMAATQTGSYATEVIMKDNTEKEVLKMWVYVSIIQV